MGNQQRSPLVVRAEERVKVGRKQAEESLETRGVCVCGFYSNAQGGFVTVSLLQVQNRTLS